MKRIRPTKLPNHPAGSAPVRARQYADRLDEDALHDQLMVAIMSEEPAHQEAQATLPLRSPEEGRGMAFDLVDPIILPRRHD